MILPTSALISMRMFFFEKVLLFKLKHKSSVYSILMEGLRARALLISLSESSQMNAFLW
jgi:hypothetical protein